MNERFVVNATLFRQDLLRRLLDTGTRDLDKECGYPTTISPQDYRALYDREGIARRVVNCLPEESWAMDPSIYETEDPDKTEFEEAVDTLIEKHNLFHYLERADELSGIGRFGIILLGLDDGKDLSLPVDGIAEDGSPQSTSSAHSLLYLRAFDESVVSVKTRQVDPKNPRYGLPVLYTVNFQDMSSSGSTDYLSRDVHWTRVIHIADSRLTSEIYGTPRMQPVYNRILDIRKLLGGSSEMYWRGAFPGYAFEVNPELRDQGVEIDADSIRTEFEKYTEGLQRYLALTGVTAKALSPQVSDPTGHIEGQLKAIAISLSIPFRILFGSEQAQLASSQDARNWAKRLNKRQSKYITPMIIRPLVDRLIAFGVLPQPGEEGYQVDWPDLASLSDQERAQVAATRTQALASYVGGGVDQLIPPRTYLMQVVGMTSEEVDAVMKEAEEYAEEEATSSENPSGAFPGVESETEGG